ncbi:MAG: SH3 domain-containing protein [Chloroflexota bacterium]|nr:SH3 domain-containing protein [Chloroflexota bacterium]
MLWLFAAMAPHGGIVQAQTFLSNFRATSITPVSISLAWDTDSSGPFTVILQTADSITIRSETATSASHTFYSLTPATRYRFVVQNQGVFLIQFVGPIRTTALGQTFSVGSPGNLVATVEFEGCLRNGVSVERHRVTYSTNSGLTSLPSDGWLFSATAGDVVTIVMTRLDGDLRPVIRFYDPTVTGFIGRYDHGGGATAQVSSYSIPSTGIYTILSGTDGHSHNTEDGNFRLTLTWNSGTPGTVSNCVRLPSGGGSGGGSGGSGGGKSKPKVTAPKPSHEERADRDRQQLRDKHGIEFVAPDFVSPKKLDDNCGYRAELKRLPCSSAVNLNDGDPNNQLINSDNPVDICFNKKNGFLAIIKTGVPETLEALDTCWDSDNNKTCARVASEGTVVLVDHSEPTSTDWFYKELGGRTISRSRCLSDPPPDIQVSPPVQQPVDQPAPIDPQPAQADGSITHVVRGGESCYRIAQSYFPDVQNPNAKLDRLRELNPGKCHSGYVLQVGEQLKIRDKTVPDPSDVPEPQPPFIEEIGSDDVDLGADIDIEVIGAVKITPQPGQEDAKFNTLHCFKQEGIPVFLDANNNRKTIDAFKRGSETCVIIDSTDGAGTVALLPSNFNSLLLWAETADLKDRLFEGAEEASEAFSGGFLIGLGSGLIGIGVEHLPVTTGLKPGEAKQAALYFDQLGKQLELLSGVGADLATINWDEVEATIWDLAEVFVKVGVSTGLTHLGKHLGHAICTKLAIATAGALAPSIPICGVVGSGVGSGIAHVLIKAYDERESIAAFIKDTAFFMNEAASIASKTISDIARNAYAKSQEAFDIALEKGEEAAQEFLAREDVQRVIATHETYVFMAKRAAGEAKEEVDAVYDSLTSKDLSLLDKVRILGEISLEVKKLPIRVVASATSEFLNIAGYQSISTEQECKATTPAGVNFRWLPPTNILTTAIPRKGSIPAGNTLEVLGRTDNWVQVVRNGQVGWISADYVNTQGDCA